MVLQFSEDELVADEFDAFANLRDEVTVQTKTSAPRKGKGKGARGRRSGDDEEEDVVPVLTIRDRFGSKEDDEEEEEEDEEEQDDDDEDAGPKDDVFLTLSLIFSFIYETAPFLQIDAIGADWGSNRGVFYNTEYVDPDWGEFS